MSIYLNFIMSKIICFSIPLFGHVNYGLKIAKYLKERGHEVLYYSGTTYRRFIEDKGIRFVQYSKKIEEMFSNPDTSYSSEHMKNVNPENIDYVEQVIGYAYHLFEIESNFLKYDIENLVDESPDLIIYDTAAIWGREVALLLNIPCVCSSTPYSLPDELMCDEPLLLSKLVFHQEMSEKYLNKLYKKMNILLNSKFDNKLNCTINESWCGRGDLNIIYSVRSIQLGEKYLSENKYKFVGILIEEGEDKVNIDKFISDKKNIYISFGTIFNSVGLIKKVVQELKDLDYNFILNIGNAIDEKIFYYLSDNWKIVHSISQLSLLRKVDAFITHGGANSMREAAHYGVPTLVIPWEGDTLCTAEDVKNGKYGIVLELDELSSLREALNDLLTNEIIRENCRKLAMKMQKAGGLKTAVELIENLL